MVLRRVIVIALVASLCLGYGVSYSRTARHRAAQPPETLRAQALALDPKILKIISGPFKGLMANYLILKASVFIGGSWDTTEEDWEAVYTLLKQSLYLDPLFFQTGYYIQGLLSWRPQMHEKAVALLKFQADRRDWDWEPMFYAGFNCFIYLKDTVRSAEYLQKAALRPGAPAIVTTLSARMAQRSGQTLTAIALLKTMLEQAEDEYTQSLYAKRLEAYIGIHQLEQAIDAFEKSSLRRPQTLDELVEGGVIAELPINPFGTRFIYEPETGMVFFDDVR